MYFSKARITKKSRDITKKDQRGKTVTDMEKLSRHNSIVAFSDDSNPVLHSRLIL